MTSVDQAQKLTKQLWQESQLERNRLWKIHRYSKGNHDSVYEPRGANAEFKWISSRSRYNLLPLVVSTIAQNLYVDGYRRKSEESDTDAWNIWQANRFDVFQAGIYRSAVRYGTGYAVSLPGELTVDDETESMPSLRPVSALRMLAAYDDEVIDEWPRFAIETSVGRNYEGKRAFTVRFYDDNQIHTFQADDSNFTRLEHTGTEDHETGFCPVVRYRNIIDLDGDNWGEVEPLIPMQDQINFTTYGLLMAQLYSAFRQRWATGLAKSDDQNFKPRADAMIASESTETKFGEFAATDLQGYLKSREETIRGIAITAQLPPYQFLGTDDLASAEALAAARDGLDRLVNERQQSFGESHEQLLRVASLQKGDKTGWNDMNARVVWRDTSTRAFAAIVDALVKLASIGVPPKALWSMIPGVTKTEAAEWEEMAENNPDELTRILGGLEARNRQVGNGSANAGVPGRGGSAGGQPSAGSPAGR